MPKERGEQKKEEEISLDDMTPEDLLKKYTETNELMTYVEAETRRLRDQLNKVADKYLKMTGRLALEDEQKKQAKENPVDTKAGEK